MEKNWIIATKKGKGKLPIFCGNGERVILIYAVQHFNNTMSRTDLRKCMTFMAINQLNLIGAMKTFTERNCNLCMQERLTILKNLCDKRVTVVNKNPEIYGACRHKTTFH